MLVVPRPLLHPSLHALPLAFSHVWLFFPCCCWRMLSPSSCVGLGLSRSVSSTIRPILLSPHLISLNYLSSFSSPIPQFLSSAEFLLSPSFLPPSCSKLCLLLCSNYSPFSPLLTHLSPFVLPILQNQIHPQSPGCCRSSLALCRVSTHCFCCYPLCFLAPMCYSALQVVEEEQ